MIYLRIRNPAPHLTKFGEGNPYFERSGIQHRGWRAADRSGADLELSQPSTHRLLKTLIAENLVEQLPDKKAYRLSLEFFAMAAQARQRDGILNIARPSLLRLSTTFNDTVFLLVRSNFDAVCLDRVEGPFPIRSFTGDIGGKVPLGIGQGSLAILSFLPEEEREAIICASTCPCILDKSSVDEVDLRIMIEEVRKSGAATFNFNMIDGTWRVSAYQF